MSHFIDIIDKITKILANIFFIVVLFLIIILVIDNSLENKLVINEISINSKLINEGYNSKIISSKLISEINDIQNFGHNSFKKEFENSEVEVTNRRPIELNISGIDSYFSLFLKFFDKNDYIDGTASFDSLYRITLLLNDRVMESNALSMNSAIRSAALMILEKIDPIDLSAYLNTTRDPYAEEFSLQLLNDDLSFNDPFARHYYGTSQLFKKKWKQSRENLMAAANSVTKYELATPSFNNIGVSYFEEFKSMKPKEQNNHLDLLDSAMVYYNKAIALDSTYSGSYFNIGNLYSFKNNLDSAIFFTTKAISMRPNDPSYLGALSYLYYRNNEYIKSDSVLNTAMEIRPLNPHLYSFYIYLGVLRERLNLDIEKEVKILECLDYTVNKDIFANFMKVYRANFKLDSSLNKDQENMNF